MRKDGELNQGYSNWDDEKRSDSESSLTIEVGGLPVKIDVNMKKKKAQRLLIISCLSNCMKAVVLNYEEEGASRASLGEYEEICFKCKVWDVCSY